MMKVIGSADSLDQMTDEQLLSRYRNEGRPEDFDELVRSRPDGRIYEAHPELAFWQMNGGQACRWAKRHRKGRDERKRLLGQAGLPVAAALARCSKGAGEIDLLDALAVAGTALRIARGEAQSLPAAPRRDGMGLPMAIWC